ncbi:hypothetical protein DOY81_010089 [Sarcophaga bullata]|nr:hypothetical protein DOY81_010089 [Sarcophaga bullata]
MDSASAPYNKAEHSLQDIRDQQQDMAQTPNYNLPANAPPTIFNVTPSGPAQVFPQPVGPKSMKMTCPHCRCRIETSVRYKATAETHIACLLLSWTFKETYWLANG